MLVGGWGDFSGEDGSPAMLARSLLNIFYLLVIIVLELGLNSLVEKNTTPKGI